MSIYLEREQAKNQNECPYLKDLLRHVKALKQACMHSPVLAFADYTKDFLLETDASKEGL